MKMTKRVGFGADEPTSENLPADLSAALAAADGVLAKHDRLRAILADTHVSIPRCLADERRLSAELGAAEVGGGDIAALKARLATVSSGRATDVRRRQAAAAGILTMESELVSARESVNASRESYATQVIATFHQKYAEALAVLKTLQVEGAELSKSLRTFVHLPTVPTKPPAVPLLESFRDALRPPSAVERIGATLDRLDSASALAGGIHASRTLDSRFIRMQELDNGATGNVTGVFRVMKPIRCQFDGLEFAPGTILDASLFGGPGSLRRAVTARFVRLVSDATADVAAA